MEDLERVMGIKDVKKKGQYYLQRRIVSKSGAKTIKKDDGKTFIFMTGRCPTCNEVFFSDYDTEVEAVEMPCAKKECTTKFKFIDGALKYLETK